MELEVQKLGGNKGSSLTDGKGEVAVGGRK